MYIVEITGIAGSGKSYIISKIKDLNVIEKFKLNDFKLFYYFISTQSSFIIFNLIVKIAYKLEFSVFDKINFIRNSMKKIGKYYYYKTIKKNLDDIIVIDEGISHLYQNIVNINSMQNDDVTSLLQILMTYIDKPDKIIIIEASRNTIYKRLKTRGHKKILREEELNNFINNSFYNLDKCKIYFKNNYEIIFNEEDGFKSDQYSNIIKAIYDEIYCKRR